MCLRTLTNVHFRDTTMELTRGRRNKNFDAIMYGYGVISEYVKLLIPPLCGQFSQRLVYPTIPLHPQLSQSSEERQHVEWEPAKEKRQNHGDHQTQHVDQSTRILLQVVRGGQQVHGDSAVAACYDNKRQKESKDVLRKS